MITIVQVESPEQVAQVRDLMAEYVSFIRTDVDNHLPDPHNAPPMAGAEEELAGLPGLYQPPAGRLLLALADGTPVGCVGLRPYEGSIGEVKRLWVRPIARGLGAGRALVQRWSPRRALQAIRG